MGCLVFFKRKWVLAALFIVTPAGFLSKSHIIQENYAESPKE
jgi:hypothetical protein